jgi:hypothetical protein
VDPTVEERAAAPWVRRLLEVTAFVAVWVTLGYLLPVDANAYLLLGVPLTAVFQLLARRRPLRELWVRDGAPFRLGRGAVALAALLAVVPLVAGVRALAAGAWVVAGWTACAVAGAVPAAWTLSRGPLRQTLRAAAPATVVGILLMAASAGAALAAVGRPLDVPDMLGTGLRSALLYLPAGFVLEEVTFRGALDAHVHHPGGIPRVPQRGFRVRAVGTLAPATRAPHRPAVDHARPAGRGARRPRRPAVVRLAAHRQPGGAGPRTRADRRRAQRPARRRPVIRAKVA